MKSLNIRYLPQVDHLRALAALWILLYHGKQLLGARLALGQSFDAEQWTYTTNPFYSLILEGHTAVALFMVLSGFIFTYGAFGRNISYKDFVYNRFLRIYPLYLCLLFLILTVNSSIEKPVSLSSLLVTLLPLADFGWQDGSQLVPMSWAVAVEFQFYLIYPFLLFFFNKKPLKVTLSILGVALLFRIIGIWLWADPRDFSYWHLIGRIDQFILGMYTAVLVLRHEGNTRIFKTTLVISVPFTILVLYGFHRLGGWPNFANWKVLWPTVEGSMWSLLIFGYVGSRQLWPNWISSLLVLVGEASFSIYLLHILVIRGFENRLHLLFRPSGNGNIDAVISTIILVVPITLFISFITYRVIELPFLQLRRQYLISK
jgi:peptidoglycan/LPS O-acetylase OafA/YrhL